jgi:hypothetical protein
MMSEASKNILRHQVLELRKGYRIARERWLIAKKETETAYASCQVLRDSIQTVQRDCGDRIDIDPSYPEDDAHFKPLDPIDAVRSTERAGVFTNGDPK